MNSQTRHYGRITKEFMFYECYPQKQSATLYPKK